MCERTRKHSNPEVNTMLRRIAGSFALVSLIALPLMAAAASKDGWPGTRAGAMARQWVEAFSTSEAAMREFNSKNLAPRSLEKKSLSERVESYRKLRDRFGKLMFGSVVKSQPTELTVKLIASDASTQSFVFTVQKEAPHKLISVGMLERRNHGFGGFHH